MPPSNSTTRGDRDRGDEGPRPRLIIDSGWREVAETALAFVQRFTGGPVNGWRLLGTPAGQDLPGLVDESFAVLAGLAG
jgi:hypothetical protein